MKELRNLELDLRQENILSEMEMISILGGVLRRASTNNEKCADNEDCSYNTECSTNQSCHHGIRSHCNSSCVGNTDCMGTYGGKTNPSCPVRITHGCDCKYTDVNCVGCSSQ